MSRVVRSSKFRHVFGTASKPEEQYQDLRVTRSAWDANFIKANPKFFAVAWDSAGGGSIAVVRYEDQGKISQTNPPLLSAHKRAVLDFDWHPFNDHILASVSEDANVMIWKIPDGGVTNAITEPVQTLSGHKRNVGTANFNPVASHVLATSSNDFSVKLWDVEKGANMFTVDGHTDIVQSVDWNYNGSQIASTCKDKKLRVFDPRTQSIAVCPSILISLFPSSSLHLHPRIPFFRYWLSSTTHSAHHYSHSNLNSCPSFPLSHFLRFLTQI